MRSTIGYYQPSICLTESGSFLASWGPSLTTRVKTGGMEEGNGEKEEGGGGGGRTSGPHFFLVPTKRGAEH